MNKVSYSDIRVDGYNQIISICLFSNMLFLDENRHEKGSFGDIFHSHSIIRKKELHEQHLEKI